MHAMNLDICLLTISAVYQISMALAFCYFGEHASNHVTDLSKSIYQTKWYLYPVDLQKCLPIVIGNCQRSQYFDGFGMMDLSLTTFSRVRL